MKIKNMMHVMVHLSYVIQSLRPNAHAWCRGPPVAMPSGAPTVVGAAVAGGGETRPYTCRTRSPPPDHASSTL